VEGSRPPPPTQPQRRINLFGRKAGTRIFSDFSFLNNLDELYCLKELGFLHYPSEFVFVFYLLLGVNAALLRNIVNADVRCVFLEVEFDECDFCTETRICS
jgi:hypothetical protein